MSEIRQRNVGTKGTAAVDTVTNNLATAGEAVKKAENKSRKILIRGMSSIALISGFVSVIWAGAFYLCLMIVLLQALVFRELVRVRYARYENDKREKDANVPLFRTLQWFWFAVAMFFLWGDFVHVFAKRRSSMQWLNKLFTMHEWITFVLFSFAFILSILTLRPNKEMIRYQMGHLAWTVKMALIVATFRHCAILMITE